MVEPQQPGRIVVIASVRGSCDRRVSTPGYRLARSFAGVLAVVVAPSVGIAARPVERAPDVYILAGQSNMSGRGAIDELTPAERRPDAAIRLYGNDGQWHDALDPLDDAKGQVDTVSSDTQAAVGPGLFFARDIVRRHRRPVILVPCAKGGSSIGQWRPEPSRDTLYGSCLARARAAGGRVAGILWYQGESDTGSAERAAQWPAAFATLVARFRADLNAPRLPVVFVQIAERARTAERAARYPAWTMLSDAQRTIAIPCTTMVSAKPLPLKGDELHLTTAAQRALGSLLARAMDRLRRRSCL